LAMSVIRNSASPAWRECPGKRGGSKRQQVAAFIRIRGCKRLGQKVNAAEGVIVLARKNG
jgi:hypothetical protein